MHQKYALPFVKHCQTAREAFVQNQLGNEIAKQDVEALTGTLHIFRGMRNSTKFQLVQKLKNLTI